MPDVNNSAAEEKTTMTSTQLQQLDELGTITENTISAEQDIINKFGIRQEVVIKNDKEDVIVKAKRTLLDNSKPKQELTVKCIGDDNYKVGYGVHVQIPFKAEFYDCLMWIKEVEQTWVGRVMRSATLTLTTSRVMDTVEWDDLEEIEGDGISAADPDITDVELWKDVYELLKQQLGKPYVYTHNGPDSFDCSGLVEFCYKPFSELMGFTIGRDTYTQCKQGKEVECRNVSEIPEVCQPGDLLFWYATGAPPGHVSVYIGNNRMIHAPRSGDVVKEVEITRKDLYCVRRVLPDAKIFKNATDGNYGKIPSDYLPEMKYVPSNCDEMIKNMNKYGYKQYIIKYANQHHFDPYLIAGIIAVESDGNPNCGGDYPGLMQVTNGSYNPETNIKQGCDELESKKKAINSSNMIAILHAYNCGEQIPIGIRNGGMDIEHAGIKELGDAVYDYVSRHYKNYNKVEKKYYSAKVFYAAQYLKDKKILE